MGRTQSWSEPELLGSLMHLFRQKGSGTSVRDIGEATGLHPGSLYKAFGSREELFCATIRAYNVRVVARRVELHLDSASAPLEGVRALFTSTFDGSETDVPGCLLTNTAIDGPALDGRVRAAVAAGFDLLEEGLARAYSRAIARGEVAPSCEPDVLAAQALALYQGVLVLVRFGASRKKLELITDRGLAAIGASTTPKTKTPKTTTPKTTTPKTTTRKPRRGHG